MVGEGTSSYSLQMFRMSHEASRRAETTTNILRIGLQPVLMLKKMRQLARLHLTRPPKQWAERRRAA